MGPGHRAHRDPRPRRGNRGRRDRLGPHGIRRAPVDHQQRAVPRETSYLRFDFTDATVEVEHLYGYANADWKWTPAPHVDTGKAAHWPATADVPSSHTAQLSVVLAALREGRRPPVSGADGRRVLELIAGMYQSAATGRTVDRDELTPDNPYYHSMHAAPQELSRA